MNRLNSLAVVLVLGISNAQAASITLAPVSGPVASGGQVTFDVVANFGAELVLGGGTDYSWNPAILEFVGFSFSPALAAPLHRDVSFDGFSEDPITHVKRPEPFDLQTSSLLSIAFGNFSGLPVPTDTVLGRLIFKAVGAPGSSSLVSLSDSLKWDRYFNVNSDAIPVTYTGAAAQILLTQPVPLPAAAWLLGSGILGFLGAVRRSRAS